MTSKRSYGTDMVIIDEQPTVLAQLALDEGAPLVHVQLHELDEDHDGPFFRDLPFSFLFCGHLVIMLYLGVAYGSYGLDQVDMNVTNWRDEMDDVDDEVFAKMEQFAQTTEAYVAVYPHRIIHFIVIPCAFLAFLVSYLSTAFVIPAYPKTIVASCLVGSLGWTMLVAISFCLAVHSWFAYLVSGGMIALVVFYISRVWQLIPFAAVNLGVALQGITANWGMYIVAFFFSVAGFLWTAFWFYVTMGLESASLNSHQNGDHKASKVKQDDDDDGGGFTFFLLLVSLYWTTTVLLNTVQVTVAGVMATWCYDKQDATFCCSPAVTSSLYRSLTFSFGSICFGSLMQAIMTALRIIIENARNNRDNQERCEGGAILLCILECIIRLLEDVIEYFNQWAYVFVGIYGYSYLESGKKVMELFRARGWTALITNDLVGYVLGFTTFTVAIITGLSAIAIDAIVTKRHSSDDALPSYILGPVPGPGYWAFGIGFIVGVAVCSVMMSVVKGAVNTLIVCFADAPGKLEDNHPEATKEMSEAWCSVFPDSGVRPSQYSVVV